MNEKSLDILNQYEFNIYRVNRGRGGMIINTNEGVKLFLECSRQEKFYERECFITENVSKNGFDQVDTYTRNSNGDLITSDEEGRRYIVKNWFDGRECNVKDAMDVQKAVTSLGQLHKALNKVSETLCEKPQIMAAEVPDKLHNIQDCKGEENEYQVDNENVKNTHFEKCQHIDKNQSMRDMYTRHMKELKMAMNYLKNKKRKSEFEQLAYRNIGQFYEEAIEAVKMFNDKYLDKRFDRVYKMAELSHGSFNYHNIIVGNNYTAITNFDRCRNECQISDLYQFMRKILEKCNWNIETAYKIMEDYDKVQPISDEDLELLSAMLHFPEKFWKIINYYFNSNKAWIPPKSIEKLNKAVEQNSKRREFLATLV